MGFSLEKFEAYAYSRNKEMGMRELIGLLQELDSNYGGLGASFQALPLNSVPRDEFERHILTRLTSAISCLLSDAELAISPAWERQVLTMHRWLATLFAASPFLNADHIMRALNIKDDKSNLSDLELASKDLLKFCLLYTPDSEVPLNLDLFWEGNKVLAAGLCLVLISPRFLGSPLAHAKREQILPWLTTHLDQIDDIDQLPIGVLHDLYMHCSYADRADKHDVKKSINSLILRKLQQCQVFDFTFPAPLSIDSKKLNAKPVMLVVIEWFGSSHSIYRTHSRTIESAKRHFNIVGMGFERCVDDITRQVFDEFIPIVADAPVVDQLVQIQGKAREVNAVVCYMPSVGMFPLTMWLANLRVAPLQMMALGHPATSHAHAIDYVVVEDDYVGSESCFSEKLLRLPKDGMPYRPSASSGKLPSLSPLKRNPDVVQIVVCATTMKINPRFLDACSQILNKATVNIHFKFLVGQAQGLLFPNVQRVIKSYLGNNVTVYPHQDYASYMSVIGECDMFINPFPFGNTNGIIDTVSAGLVGVCKTGSEVHEHIDQGIFSRLGFPEWLIAQDVESYIESAVRLAENHKERFILGKNLAGADKLKILFKGRPEIFGDLVYSLVKNL